MNPIIRKTFGGLTLAYYIRQFLFSLIFTIPMIWMFVWIAQGRPEGAEDGPMLVILILFCVLNSFLYPYSRFVYESIVAYVIGDNVFFLPLAVIVPVKIVMMSICYSFAVFIAPFGLVFLYFFHSKRENVQSQL